MSINSKITAFSVALLLIAISLCMSLTIWIVKGSQTRGLSQSLEKSEQLVNSLIESQSIVLTDESKLVGILPILATVVENGDPDTVADSASSYKEDLHLSVFTVFDGEGELLVDIDGQDRESKEFDQVQSLIQDALDGDSNSTITLIDGKLALVAVAPIGIPEDPVGVLLLGRFLDNAFAGNIKNLTGSDIILQANSMIRASSIGDTTKEDIASLGVDLSKVESGARYENNDYFLGFSAIENSEGQKVGDYGIRISKLEANETVQSILKIVALAGGGIVVFSLICLLFMARRISKPIINLTEITREIVETQDLSRRTKASSILEISKLGQSFNALLEKIQKAQEELDEYNSQLEVKVDERTKELKIAQTEISEMLDNMKQAIFTFDSDLAINENHSKYLLEIFKSEKSPAGTCAYEFLYGKSHLDEDQRRRVRFTMETIFGSDDFQWTMSSYEFPAEIEVKNDDDSIQYIRISYEPIWDEEGNIRRILVVMQDVTSLKNLEAEASAKQRELQKISDLTSITQDVFFSFVEESENMFNECFEEIDNLASRKISHEQAIAHLFRNIHTIKGNSRLFKLVSIQEVAHETETYLAEVRDGKQEFSHEMLPEFREKVKFIADEVHSYSELRTNVFGKADTGRKVGYGEFSWLRTITSRLFDELAHATGISLDSTQQLRDEFDHVLRDLSHVSVESYVKRYGDMLSDLSVNLEKKIKPIVVTGNYKLIDKSQMSRVNDMLVHCLRNALDHGIELPDDRVNKGKDPAGQVSLDFSLMDGLTCITIRDDGKGIDPEVIRKKVMEKKLIEESLVNKIPDDEILNFIFATGFSTAATVSDVSGRGVGMDAVKYIAEELGGGVALKSKVGDGSEISIKFPVPKSEWSTDYEINNIEQISNRLQTALEPLLEMHRINLEWSGSHTPLIFTPGHENPFSLVHSVLEQLIKSCNDSSKIEATIVQSDGICIRLKVVDQSNQVQQINFPKDIENTVLTNESLLVRIGSDFLLSSQVVHVLLDEGLDFQNVLDSHKKSHMFADFIKFYSSSDKEQFTEIIKTNKGIVVSKNFVEEDPFTKIYAHENINACIITGCVKSMGLSADGFSHPPIVIEDTSRSEQLLQPIYMLVNFALIKQYQESQEEAVSQVA